MSMKLRIADLLNPWILLGADIIQCSSNQLTDVDIQQSFHFVMAASIDIHVFQHCWGSLGKLASSILDWLSEARMPLILVWSQSSLFAFSDGDNIDTLLRLCRLFTVQSQLGRTAARILLDDALGMMPPCELEDSDFISGACALIGELSRDKEKGVFKHADLLLLYPKLRLLAERLFLTVYVPNSKGLLDSLAQLKDFIPVNHYPIFIAVRDLVVKMQTHLQLSFLKATRASPITMNK